LTRFGEWDRTNAVSKHLFIVSRQQPDLFSYLHREFREEPDVRVILDRRVGERRQRSNAPAYDHADRRHGQRRGNTEIGSQLSSMGYAFVRLA